MTLSFILFLVLFSLIIYAFYHFRILDFSIKVGSVINLFVTIYIAIMLTLIFLALIVPNNMELLYNFDFNKLCNFLGISLEAKVAAPIINENVNLATQLQPFLKQVADSINSLNTNITELNNTLKAGNTTNAALLKEIKVAVVESNKNLSTLKSSLQSLDSNISSLNIRKLESTLTFMQNVLVETHNITQQGWTKYILSHNIKIEKVNEMQAILNSMAINLNAVGLKVDNLTTVTNTSFLNLQTSISTDFETLKQSTDAINNTMLETKKQFAEDFQKLIKSLDYDLTTMKSDVKDIKTVVTPTNVEAEAPNKSGWFSGITNILYPK